MADMTPTGFPTIPDDVETFHDHTRALLRMIEQADNPATNTERAFLRRDTLIEAFCVITGEDPDAVQEHLDGIRQAEHALVEAETDLMERD
jgi:hypothetical protein